MESINNSTGIIRNRFFPSNTYILSQEGSRDSIIIDPGLDTEAVESYIAESGIKPIAVIATHGHFDHIGGVALLQRKYDIPYYLHVEDVKISKAANFFLKMLKLNIAIETPQPDYLFKGGEEQLSIGGFHLGIVNLPGHTQGSCVIQWGCNLYSGDLIYKEGLGFNHFPGENKPTLKKSLNELLHRFDDKTIIYPGHGAPATLEDIKKHNKELIDFLKEQ